MPATRFVPVSALNHYTIRCNEDELPALRDFCSRALGLQPGNRPQLPAPGTWHYAEGRPIVHLHALLEHADDGPQVSTMISGSEQVLHHGVGHVTVMQAADRVARHLEEFLLRREAVQADSR